MFINEFLKASSVFAQSWKFKIGSEEKSIKQLKNFQKTKSKNVLKQKCKCKTLTIKHMDILYR